MIAHLELGRHAPEAGGDPKKKPVVIGESAECGEGVVRLGRSAHELEDVFGECLRYSSEVRSYFISVYDDEA